MLNFESSGGGSYPHSSPYDYARYEALRQSEYRQLRRHGTYVGICILAYFLLQQVFSLLLVILGVSDAYQTNASFFNAFNAVFFSVLSLGLPFLLLSLRPGSPSYFGVLPFNPSKKRRIAVLVVVGGFGACMLANFIAYFAVEILSGAGIEEIQPDDPVSRNAFDVFLNLLCTAAVPALVEEFVFRGVVMQPLRRCGEHFAVFATAFVFGLAHGTVSGFVFAFLVGLVLGYAAVLTGSLWPGILIHFLNNFYAGVITELSGTNSHLADLLSDIIVYTGLVLGAVSVVILVLSRSFRLTDGRTGQLLNGQRFRGFFLSVPMLISVAVFLFFITIINLK